MNRWGLWASLFVLFGCGGGAGQPQSADDLEETETTVSRVDDDGAGDEEPPPEDEAAGSDEEGDEPSGGGSASTEDVSKVLQLVIDDEALDKFLHLEQAGRFPLKVAGDIPSGVELTKNTQPVERVDESEASEKAVLVFTQIDLSPKQATVKYRYDIEGVRGTAVVVKGEYGWELKSSRVTEHKTP